MMRVLPVAYIGPKSRTERPTKTKIGTEVVHVTCDLDATFNDLQRAGAYCGSLPHSLKWFCYVFYMVAFSTLTLLVRRRYGHLACEKSWVLACWWWWFDWSQVEIICTRLAIITATSDISCYSETQNGSTFWLTGAHPGWYCIFKQMQYHKWFICTMLFSVFSLQCLDTVGWATGRASGLYKVGCWFVGSNNLTGALHIL